MDRKIKQQKFSVSSKLLNARHVSQFAISHTVKETINDFDKNFTFASGDVEIIWRLKWSRASTKTCDGKGDRL